MTDASEWQGRVGQSWASEWRRTDRAFGPLTERLLQRAREFGFTSVLDVGCGAGELSLALARGRPHCRVVGVDISPQLIAAARERGGNRPNLAFELGDAAVWRPDPGFAPELLVSRHGVMFFDRPAAAFAHLGEIAAPRAGMLFSCFRAWEENPAFADPAGLLPSPPSPPDPRAPGPFAFADRDYVEALLTETGWRDIAFEAFDFAMILGAGADPVEDTVGYLSVIGTTARVSRELDPAERERFFDKIRKLAARHLREGIVSMRAGVWIVTARRR